MLRFFYSLAIRKKDSRQFCIFISVTIGIIYKLLLINTGCRYDLHYISLIFQIMADSEMIPIK